MMMMMIIVLEYIKYPRNQSIALICYQRSVFILKTHATNVIKVKKNITEYPIFDKWKHANYGLTTTLHDYSFQFCFTTCWYDKASTPPQLNNQATKPWMISSSWMARNLTKNESEEVEVTHAMILLLNSR